MNKKIKESLNNGINFLISEKKEGGYWNNGFNSSSLATAIASIVYSEYDNKKESKKAMTWLLENQNEDGGWGDIDSSLSEPNSTLCGIAAIKINNNLKDESLLNKFLDINVSPQTLCYLAHVGLIKWDDIKIPPLRMISNPIIFNEKEFKLSEPMVFIEKFSSSIVSLLKTINSNDRNNYCFVNNTFFNALKFQSPNGSWFGYTHSTALMLLAMKHFKFDNKCSALNWILKMQDECGGVSISEGLPIHDTALSLMMLKKGGLNINNQKKSKRWLLDAQEINGGWGWIPKYSPPDSDDTSLSFLALNLYDECEEIVVSKNKAINWLKLRQLNNGAIATFPEDYEGIISGGKIPSISVTSRVLKAFKIMGCNNEYDKAEKYLKNSLNNENLFQDWFGGYYSLSLSFEVLMDDGIDKRCLDRIINALIKKQNKNGSWGNEFEPNGCVEETAFVLYILILAGVKISNKIVKNGIAYILESQLNDGSWNSSYLGFIPPIRYNNKIWTLYSVIRVFDLILKNKY